MRRQLFHSKIAFAIAAAATSVIGIHVHGQEQETRARQVAGCNYVKPEFNRCALEKAKTYNSPRTPDGKPDLQGLWTAPGGAYDFEGRRSDSVPFRLERSLIVDPADGRIPFLPWALEQQKANQAGYIDPYWSCLPIGPPRQLSYFRSHQITQRPGYVTIVNEAGAHVFRVIYTDGRPHVSPNTKLWMGDSRGKWEGNTLVIDTTNFNGRTWPDPSGSFSSDALHVVERITPVDANTLHYTATLEDPKVYARPFTIVYALGRMEAGYEQLEEACHEGDRDTERMLKIGHKHYTGPRFPTTPSAR